MRIGIVAGGPKELLANLLAFQHQIDFWIGADLGAKYLLDAGIDIHMAVGDFDSVSVHDKELIKATTPRFVLYPTEKDETDLELAIRLALEQEPDSIQLFGVTGGRLDHELANIHLLYRLMKRNVFGEIVDHQNQLSLYKSGKYHIKNVHPGQYISFIPFSQMVKNLTLKGFYYPLDKITIEWGSTLCISNQIIDEQGTFSFTDGILIMIKSVDPLKS